MHDFFCSRPEDMHYAVLAERAEQFKYGKGGIQDTAVIPCPAAARALVGALNLHVDDPALRIGSQDVHMDGPAMEVVQLLLRPYDYTTEYRFALA